MVYPKISVNNKFWFYIQHFGSVLEVDLLTPPPLLTVSSFSIFPPNHKMPFKFGQGNHFPSITCMTTIAKLDYFLLLCTQKIHNFE